MPGRPRRERPPVDAGGYSVLSSVDELPHSTRAPESGA
jgi:hypothetical protein